jgi:hypothetical protein
VCPRSAPPTKEAVLSSCGQKTATVEDNVPHVIGTLRVRTRSPPDKSGCRSTGPACAPLRDDLRSAPGRLPLHSGAPWPRCGPAVEKRSGFARAHPERRNTPLFSAPLALTVHPTHQLTPTLVQPAGGRASPGPTTRIPPRPANPVLALACSGLACAPTSAVAAHLSLFFAPLEWG